MAESLSSTCQLFGIQSGAAAMICMALALLLLALIMLGFGPLRAWFGPAVSRRLLGERPAAREEGLIAMWRLYQRLGRAGAPRG
ncbi:MAG: hypothetical protein ACRDJE_22250 [Dehalococcoidia bacterium]